MRSISDVLHHDGMDATSSIQYSESIQAVFGTGTETGLPPGKDGLTAMFTQESASGDGWHDLLPFALCGKIYNNDLGRPFLMLTTIFASYTTRRTDLTLFLVQSSLSWELCRSGL
ncbi:MAG: hypothetical protein ACLRS8_05890 [Parabacteroides merdae]